VVVGGQTNRPSRNISIDAAFLHMYMYVYPTHWPPMREQRDSVPDAGAAHLSMQARGAALSTHARPTTFSNGSPDPLKREPAANFLMPHITPANQDSLGPMLARCG
jgi:hypothetical protein